MHLALQALRKYTPTTTTNNNNQEDKDEEGEDTPSLLLLLATTNADKPSSSPASYDHRLAMMCLLAEEIQNTIYSSNINKILPQIDIAITPHPRFIDKSTDLSSHPFFPSESTRQIWILGYDTLIRLLNPKYYPQTHTPKDLHKTLLSSKNRILVFTRPDTHLGTTQSSQYEYLNSLDPSIAEKVDMVVPEHSDQVEGVSSTNVRNGVKSGIDDEEGWKGGVCRGVAEWIGREGLYL
ncbi:hypothetical protein TWF506_004262 [Arthrobotrys conoides]